MRAAYLAYDRHSLSTLDFLSHHFEQVDFYLVEEQHEVRLTNFDDVSIMTETLVIPAEPELRTEAHRKVLKAIHAELSFYKKELRMASRKNLAEASGSSRSTKHEINSISLIKDIVFNAKTNHVYIEKEISGISEYNYLFIEDHQVVSENFNRFATNIFKSQPLNSHVWFTIEFNYAMKKSRGRSINNQKFILIKDRQNRSVLDNWYFIRTEADKILVQQWVPFNQYKNSDFQKFMVERAEKLLKEKLDLIQITQFNQHYVNATPGFSRDEARLKNNKISSLMPSFNFWPKESIAPYLNSKIDTKMRDLQKILMAPTNLPRG